MNNIKVGVGVMIIDNNKILLGHRNPTKKDTGGILEPDTWTLPGGKQEYKETIFECGIREVKEETNLDITNPQLFDIKANVHMVYPNKDEVYYTDVVYIINEFFGDLKPDGESTELRFFGLDELPENIMPTQIGYIERFIKEKNKGWYSVIP